MRESLRSGEKPDAVLLDVRLPDLSGLECSKSCDRLIPSFP